MQIQALSNLDTGNAISVAVAKKAMQSDRAQGEAMVEMLRACCDQGSTGGRASPDGVGQRIDIDA